MTSSNSSTLCSHQGRLLPVAFIVDGDAIDVVMPPEKSPCLDECDQLAFPILQASPGRCFDNITRERVMLPQLEIRGIEYDIQTLAQQFSLPIKEAHDILWGEIHHLETQARIRDFVPLLAIKEVKESLRNLRPH